MIDLMEDARRIHAAKINAIINMTVLDMLKSGDVNRAGYDLAFPENSPATLDDLRMVVSGKLGPWQSAIGYQQNVDLIAWVRFSK